MLLTKRSAILFGGLFFCALAALAAFTIMMAPDAGHHVASLVDVHNQHGFWAEIPLAALRASRLDVVKQMTAMLDASESENRDLTAEEVAAYDALKAQKTALDNRIARAEDMAASNAALDAVAPAASRNAQIQRPAGDPARREFESMGEFMHAVRFNPNDQRLNYVENAAGEEGDLRSELRTDEGASGGFMIPPQLRQTLLALTPQQAIIRPRATVIEAGNPPDAPVTMPALDQSGAAPSNMFGGVEVQWIGEGDTKPETDLKLREITLTPHEVAGTITVTDKLLRNWQAAGPLLETQLRGASAQAEDYAFLLGNGIKKPLGVLKASATLKVNRKVANQIQYDDVAEMVGRGYGNGTFVYSRSALVWLLKLKDADGRPLWVPSMREGEPATLMGRPAITSDRNPQLGSLGDLWYGDLSQYLIKDGSGPFVAASEHVLFRQNKTVIKIFWNVDGSPWLTAPFALENGYLVSPFVALDVPAI
ncbi:phage major capsid protein [Devosia sp. 1635]|uniref:phage major capsid protein n=1 Tax=Devosia sp. 1635 TaxID=2726066 RepID=UPI0020C1579C|nr:phage major capsid protein [Devosia sp. 1635]